MASGPVFLKTVSILSILSFLAIAVGTASGAFTEYNQFRGDNDNSGASGSEGVPLPEMLWKFKSDGKLESSPVVANNKVYFGSKDKSVYAVDALTGGEVWRFATEGDISCTPLVKSGKCFIGSGDGNLYCLNAEYGTDQWSFKTGGQIISSPKYYKNKLFFGSDDGKLYSIWADNGSEAWNYSMSEKPQRFWSSAAISGGVLFIGDEWGKFAVLDTETGRELYNTSVLGDIFVSACLYDDYVIISNGEGRQVINYKWTGTELIKEWVFDTHDDIYTNAAVYNGYVIFADYKYVYSVPLEDADGVISEEEVLWKFDFSLGGNYIANDEGGSSPLIVSDRVVIGSKESLHCIFAENGTEDWTVEAPRGGMVSSPTYVDHYLYYTGNDQHLYCYLGRDTSVAVVGDDDTEDEEFDPYFSYTIPICLFVIVDLLMLVVIIIVLVLRRRAAK